MLWKGKGKRRMHSMKQKQQKHASITNAVEMLMNHQGAQPMATANQVVKKWTASGQYADAKAGRCLKMTKDTQQFMIHAKIMEKRCQCKSLIQFKNFQLI